MKLIASVIVRDELGRYLDLCIASLLEYCDEIRVLDDESTDGWEEALRPGWGKAGARVHVLRRERGEGGAFHRHAIGRDQLLQWTLKAEPSHILAIDADELVSDGARLRRLCQQRPGHLSLEMCEVWQPCEERLCVRTDGGWKPRQVAMLWRPDLRLYHRIRDRGSATGRTPESLRRESAEVAEVACFHFGWAREAERVERAARYDSAPGHAKAHTDSILWPASRVRLEGWAWPPALEPIKGELLKRTQLVEVT